MKTHALVKAKGTTCRVSNKHVSFDLKHRVVLALNKLADRDTYQIGVEDLEKVVESLTSDGVVPFLSCILDMDSEQKSAVRKECIRLMGTLASFHEGFIGPHLGKMVASIVKRLKDSDSVVRDACVETAGVLASKLTTGEGEADGIFVALVRPLFEALGEQNKQVQCGSALCLSRVIDNTHDPPISILQRMLSRTIKLLKNSHFMAKSAVIELNRSIIQAGGAASQSSLTAAMNSIQESLKASDWTARKAASIALAELASSGGSFFDSFKSSCIRSLESCRFDKVKPVRDTVLQALQLWRSLPGPDTPELSEAGSSIKDLLTENFSGGSYGDTTSSSVSTLKDITLTRACNESFQKRVPLSVRKADQNYVENLQRSKANDWHIEVSVPKTHNISLSYAHDEESEGSCITKTFERSSTDITSIQDTGYEYVPMDDKHECSSLSNIVTDNFERKLVPDSHNGNVTRDLGKSTGIDEFLGDEVSTEERRYFNKIQDRRSLDSTVTESSSQIMHGCCLQTTNEMASIREKLLEIEIKQSNLLDLLKVFTNSTMDSLSMIQLKVSGLEHVVDRMAQDLVNRGRHADLSSVKLLKRSSAAASPRLSTCTPRPSIDSCNRQAPLLPTNNTEVWEEQPSVRSKLGRAPEHNVNSWMDPVVKGSRNAIGKGTQKNLGQGNPCGQTRNIDAVFSTASNTNSIHNSTEVKKNSIWKLVKGFLSQGDLDSAYVEALHFGDEIVLVELLEKTGPVLESLSHRTVHGILGTLASFILEHRFMSSIIPWLQQVVDLSTIHGPNYLVLTAKARSEFLSAIQEAMNMDFSNPGERRSITQIVVKLHQIWGKC